RLGGQLWTERIDGFVVEHGAEGFVARSEAVPALAEALGIGADLVGQAETRSYGFDGARLVPLAPGEAATFLGFQVPRDAPGRGIRTFRGGMGQLAEPLAAAIGARSAQSTMGATPAPRPPPAPPPSPRADLRPGTRVEGITPAGPRWHVALAGGAIEEVDAVA